jgi:hypothetical protein
MTPDETQQLDLAQDLLQSIQAWPEHAPTWWRLTDCVNALGEDAKARFAAQIQALQLRSTEAQWFKHSALHCLTGLREYLVRQAELAPALPDAERWMTLANIVWWEALSRAVDRDSFRQLFLDTGIVRLLDALGRGLTPAGAAGAARATGLRRVAIFAQHLSTASHAATALTFNLRALLEGAGIATRVFASQELSLAGMQGYSAGGYVSNVAPIDSATWQLRVPGPAAATVADLRFSALSRWRSLDQAIGRYEPDAVLFVGFFSPLVWALRERYPVLAMSIHAMPPLAPVDVWLSADRQPTDRLAWPGLPGLAAFHFPFRFWPTEVRAASRAQIGLAPESVLMVTSGSRVSPSALASWIDEIVRVLEQQPAAAWLLVGLDAAQAAWFERRHPRIRVLPQQEQLAAWLSLADLYLNPPRVGGGASVALAMELGVPVVAMAGGDGGDKIGTLAVADPQAYLQRVSQWLADPSARAQAGAQLKAKFRDELDLSSPAATRGLLQALTLAQQSFARRRPIPPAPRPA